MLPRVLLGQHFFRVSADFSIKEIRADSSVNLTVGKVYYDKNIKKIIYKVSFPKAETWVVYDTSVYMIQNGKVKERIKSSSIAEFSIFHLALSGDLHEFGLKNTPYKLSSVTKEDSLVIAVWKPESRLSKAFGKIVLSKLKRRIYGIAFYRPNGNLAGRQIFRKFVTIKGCDFPSEILQFQNSPKGESKQITTFKNIKIDQANDPKLFDYPLP
jgi:hypothetical protein